MDFSEIWAAYSAAPIATALVAASAIFGLVGFTAYMAREVGRIFEYFRDGE
jgi:hypothetical protein